MKAISNLLLCMSTLLVSCTMDAQVIWLTNKNVNYSDCSVQEREAQAFCSITNSSPFDVLFEQSAEPYIIVEGDEPYLSKIHTDIKGESLNITLEPGRYRNVRLRVRAGSPDIRNLSVAGSGLLECVTDIATQEEIKLQVSGSGDVITKDISCSRLSATVAGSGDMDINRINAAELNISVKGSGDMEIASVNGSDMSLSVTGSGDIDIVRVNLDGTLQANVTGSGDITVNGHARNVDAGVIGSGDLSGRLSYDSITRHRSGSGDINW